jgi:hypothetical protein
MVGHEGHDQAEPKDRDRRSGRPLRKEQQGRDAEDDRRGERNLAAIAVTAPRMVGCGTPATA